MAFVFFICTRDEKSFAHEFSNGRAPKIRTASQRGAVSSCSIASTKSAYRIGTRKKDLKVAVAYDVEATQMSQLFAILAMKQDTLGSMLTTALATAYKFLRTYYGGDQRLLSTADGIFVTNPQQRIILERYYLYPDFHTYTVPYELNWAT